MATLRLPPSTRDFELCHTMQSSGLSTWKVAKQYGISQMRVRQILRRVADWIAETLPPQMEANVQAQLRYAEHLASDRLQHHYCETMEQWRATHQTRFLAQATRVALAAGKVAAPSGLIEALAADAIEGPLEEAEAREQEAREQGTGDREQRGSDWAREGELADPPVGDFSGNDESAEEQPAADEDRAGASRERHELLALLRAGPAGAAAELSERTRWLLSAANSGSAEASEITQLRLSPQQPGARLERTASPPERELTRQERRRLQKKLKRAKGLAS